MADDSNSAPRPRSFDAAEIPELLGELEASGQSLAAFARERGLASWRLYKAKRKDSGRRRRDRVRLVLRYVNGRRHLPVVELKLAA